MTQEKIPHNRPSFGPEEEAAVTRVVQSGWLSQGVEIESFENEFCDFLGLSHGHAVAVSSGTAALALAMEGLSLKNRTVEMPAYVCRSLQAAAETVQAQTKILDTEADSPNLKVSQVTSDFAIVPHMFGIPAQVKNDPTIWDKVIEDCAHSVGAMIQGRAAGTLGQVGVFSFYSTKLLTSGGQGGMVVSRDRGCIDRIRDLREYNGRSDGRNLLNFQMTELQAAFGRAQLKKFPQFLKRRAEIFSAYQGTGLPMVASSEKSAAHQSVYYRAVLKTPEPGKWIKHLAEQGIQAVVPLSSWMTPGKENAFPNALQFSNSAVSLPIYPALRDDQLERVVQALKSGI